MLRVTIELIPMGDESRKRNLGTMEINNDTTGTSTQGNYQVRASRRGQPGSTWKTGRIIGFPRKRLGPYDLLYRALWVIVGKRNERQPTCNGCGGPYQFDTDLPTPSWTNVIRDDGLKLYVSPQREIERLRAVIERILESARGTPNSCGHCKTTAQLAAEALAPSKNQTKGVEL